MSAFAYFATFGLRWDEGRITSSETVPYLDFEVNAVLICVMDVIASTRNPARGNYLTILFKWLFDMNQ